MNITIFGMGYVGSVTAACLIKQGHYVIGVDVIESKIGELKKGKWPIYEPGLNELNSPESMKDRFFATSDDEKALQDSEVLLICVGTPEMPDGEVDISYLKSVLATIRTYVKKNSRKYCILIRSTVPFGTMRTLVYNELMDSVSQDKIGFLPEFLREGNAIEDFFSPGIKVIGCEKNFPVNILDKIFPDVAGEWIITEFELAESVKYLSNSWHALKIAFTNEVSTILNAYEINSDRAMEIFAKDRLLNISANYMRPGFAYGGSCLPKDLHALLASAKATNVKTPLLEAISESNNELINRLELFIYNQKSKNIGFCGVSFKPKTDDIRNSPIVVVIKNLISGKRSYQEQFNITIFDNEKAVKNYSNEIGLETRIVNNINEIMEFSDLIILGPYKISHDLVLQMLNQNKIIIDLKWHKLSEDISSHDNYRSLV